MTPTERLARLEAQAEQMRQALEQAHAAYVEIDNCPSPCESNRPCDKCEDRLIFGIGQVLRAALSPESGRPLLDALGKASVALANTTDALVDASYGAMRFAPVLANARAALSALSPWVSGTEGGKP